MNYNVDHNSHCVGYWLIFVLLLSVEREMNVLATHIILIGGDHITWHKQLAICGDIYINF